MWAPRERHTLLWRSAPAPVLEGPRNTAQSRGGRETAAAVWFAVVPRSCAGRRRELKFSEYIESKIAEKEALDSKEAVVTLLRERFPIE